MAGLTALVSSAVSEVGSASSAVHHCASLCIIVKWSPVGSQDKRQQLSLTAAALGLLQRLPPKEPRAKPKPVSFCSLLSLSLFLCLSLSLSVSLSLRLSLFLCGSLFAPPLRVFVELIICSEDLEADIDALVAISPLLDPLPMHGCIGSFLQLLQLRQQKKDAV